MAPDVECVERSSEVAVLAESEVVAVRADKASTDDRPGKTENTFILTVRC
jgi:hypothetical protein